jgi:hypothetical protein
LLAANEIMASESEKLYSTGADILASSRARGLPLEGGDFGDGWEPHKPDAPDGGSYASKLDEKTQVTAGASDQPPLRAPVSAGLSLWGTT